VSDRHFERLIKHLAIREAVATRRCFNCHYAVKTRRWPFRTDVHSIRRIDFIQAISIRLTGVKCTGCGNILILDVYLSDSEVARACRSDLTRGFCRGKTAA
jgi:5-methylcytosine-specific restriction endonuclease McrA